MVVLKISFFELVFLLVIDYATIYKILGIVWPACHGPTLDYAVSLRLVSLVDASWKLWGVVEGTKDSYRKLFIGLSIHLRS